MTEAQIVERVLRNEVQCVYCRKWQPIEQTNRIHWDHDAIYGKRTCSRPTAYCEANWVARFFELTGYAPSDLGNRD